MNNNSLISTSENDRAIVMQDGKIACVGMSETKWWEEILEIISAGEPVAFDPLNWLGEDGWGVKQERATAAMFAAEEAAMQRWLGKGYSRYSDG